MKTCNTCFVTKELNCFEDTRNKCRECRKEYKRKFYRDNTEMISKRDKVYRQNNKKKLAKRSKEYYKKNSEKVKKSSQKYYRDNIERLRLYHKEYRTKNKEKVNKLSREYYEENKDRLNKRGRERNRQKQLDRNKYLCKWSVRIRKKQTEQERKEKRKKYYEENKEKSKEYYRKNKEKYVEANRRFHLNNPEKAAGYARKYREKFPERAKESSRNSYDPAYNKEWRKKNPDKVQASRHRRRAKLKGSGGSFTEQEWKDLCEKYDNTCLRCGKKTKMTVDHVVPISKSGTNFIGNIQPLCLSCNSVKGNRNSTDYRKDV